MISLLIAAALMWCSILLLPWRPWRAGPCLDTAGACPEADLADVTVLIPARNEAACIVQTLQGLAAQGKHLRVIVVDDQSTDTTVQAARQAPIQALTVVSGTPLPAGWAGKLWALEQAYRHIDTPLTLLLDADIRLQPGLIPALRDKLRTDHLHLVSLMAVPVMNSFWERLLMPAFVYFFKLLYPFELANSTYPKIAAAAGGCLLIETRLLKEMGGFAALKNALIDDCTLARRIKSLGYKTWLGLTHSAHSLRPYQGLQGIWNMVARSAYTQLRYSPLWLAVCTLLMVLGFWVPVVGLWQSNGIILAITALLAMMLAYLPMLKFYHRSPAWALSLPLIGSLYLAMTWSSAIRHWCGQGAAWKGRRYAKSTLAVGMSVALLLSTALSEPSQAQEVKPSQVVTDFQNTLLQVMTDAETLGYEGRYRQLAPAVQQSHDLATIARIAVGRHWKDLDAEQQQQLVNTFAELSIATYAHRFNAHGGETFRVVSEDLSDPDEALVKSLLIESDGNQISFDYLLKSSEKGWRIVNITVEGISDLALKRAEYSGIIRREGFAALLAKLQDKIDQYTRGKN